MPDRFSLLSGYRALCAAVARHDAVAVAFSGGVDSTFLLHAAKTALGDRAIAFHAVTPLQAAGEAARAERYASQVGCRLVRFAIDPFSWPEFVANPADRCYLCKRKIFSLFQETLAAHGGKVLLDGTNLDDLSDHRPGLKAVRELGCLMPLVECGFTKAAIRQCSRLLGLASWEQPSSSCLATRIPAGMAITPENIAFVGRCENYLAYQGFPGCRARWGARTLRVEVREEDFSRVHTLSEDLLLSKLACDAGFAEVVFAARASR